MSSALEIAKAMRDAGFSLDQVVDVLDRLDLARKAARLAYRAVKLALAVLPTPAEVESAIVADLAAESGFTKAINSDSADKESGFASVGSTAALEPDSRKAIARKALLMSGRLRPAARRVGAALIERYNLSTGRCDAAVGTLANDAGYDLRSARRAIGELVDAGLFIRDLQVGRGHANSYRPCWDQLAALNADSENRTLRQNRTAESAKTIEKNLTSLSGSGENARAPFQTSLMLPLAGGADALAAARRKALVAVELSLRGKYRDDPRRGSLLAAFAGVGEVAQLVFADAEREARGGGLAAFEAWLRSHAQGPPAASGTG